MVEPRSTPDALPSSDISGVNASQQALRSDILISAHNADSRSLTLIADGKDAKGYVSFIIEC